MLKPGSAEALTRAVEGCAGALKSATMPLSSAPSVRAPGLIPYRANTCQAVDTNRAHSVSSSPRAVAYWPAASRIASRAASRLGFAAVSFSWSTTIWMVSHRPSRRPRDISTAHHSSPMSCTFGELGRAELRVRAREVLGIGVAADSVGPPHHPVADHGLAQHRAGHVVGYCSAESADNQPPRGWNPGTAAHRSARADHRICPS